MGEAIALCSGHCPKPQPAQWQDKPFNKSTLHALVGGLDFKGQALWLSRLSCFCCQTYWSVSRQSLDGSLRHFLSFFRLPGEAFLFLLFQTTRSNFLKASVRRKRLTAWWRSLQRSTAPTIRNALPMQTVHLCLAAIQTAKPWTEKLSYQSDRDIGRGNTKSWMCNKGAFVLADHASDGPAQSRHMCTADASLVHFFVSHLWIRRH